MDIDLVLGTAVTVLAVMAVVVLYVWSCRIIAQIERKKLTSLRQIRKELGHGL